VVSVGSLASERRPEAAAMAAGVAAAFEARFLFAEERRCFFARI
jgi:hypothetical protein